MSEPNINEIITAVSSAIAKEIGTAMGQLVEEKNARHLTANTIQAVSDLAHVNKTRIDNLESKVTAVLGDGTGETGAFAKMSDRQRQCQADISEVKIDVRSIKDSIAKLESIGEQGKGAMSGGKALMIALGVLSTLLTVIGAIVAGVLWFAKH